jgi:hypothetical protein
MIKYSELRSGNYICHSNGNVLKVNFHHIRYLTINPETVDYKPIQLTEEILIKCGFERVVGLGNYEKENFRFYFSNPANFNGWVFCEGYNVITEKIQYLHQLQNMYQLLTNEELIIQL